MPTFDVEKYGGIRVCYGGGDSAPTNDYDPFSGECAKYTAEGDSTPCPGQQLLYKLFTERSLVGELPPYRKACSGVMICVGNHSGATDGKFIVGRAAGEGRSPSVVAGGRVSASQGVPSAGRPGQFGGSSGAELVERRRRYEEATWIDALGGSGAATVGIRWCRASGVGAPGETMTREMSHLA